MEERLKRYWFCVFSDTDFIIGHDGVTSENSVFYQSEPDNQREHYAQARWSDGHLWKAHNGEGYIPPKLVKWLNKNINNLPVKVTNA